jgi:uncharacterized surface protein with fasciclin (FAS1) repeats
MPSGICGHSATRVDGKLTATLSYHVVPGKMIATEVVKLSQVETVQGSAAKTRVEGGRVYVDAAQIRKTETHCSSL